MVGDLDAVFVAMECKRRLKARSREGERARQDLHVCEEGEGIVQRCEEAVEAGRGGAGPSAKVSRYNACSTDPSTC